MVRFVLLFSGFLHCEKLEFFFGQNDRVSVTHSMLGLDDLSTSLIDSLHSQTLQNNKSAKLTLLLI